MVDFPGAILWRRLIEAFPTAPVVLTVRDPTDWYDSVMATIHCERDLDTFDLSNPQDRLLALNQRHIWQGELFQGRIHDRAFGIDCFSRHVEAVTSTVPAERLLLLEMGSGWGPLCRFLDLPTPDVPYPNRNSRTEFMDRADGQD